ncbi:MAG: hypothetical protein HYW01_02665 [Deltaproteobacteria bacterium]|nr:hypothetical protein [Deltaproteobacteria bacterium]
MDDSKEESHPGSSSPDKSFTENLSQRLHALYSNEYTFFILVAIFIGFFAGLANFVFVEAYGLAIIE